MRTEVARRRRQNDSKENPFFNSVIALRGTILPMRNGVFEQRKTLVAAPVIIHDRNAKRGRREIELLVEYNGAVNEGSINTI